MSVDVITIEMSNIKVCGVGIRELCFDGGGRKAGYKRLSPSRYRSSSVAVVRMSNGTAEWTHCASKFIWA